MKNMAHKLQPGGTILLIFLAVVASVVYSQASGKCLQDCSWTSYSNGKEVENGCEMLIQQEKVSKGATCPNYYESYSNEFPPEVEIVDVSYYDYLAQGSSAPSEFSSSVRDDHVTYICVNISFQIAQGGANSVKAVRLTLIPATYTDQNKVYCQVWNMTTPLTGCSFSAGHCDANNRYTFHYDCFCELGANAGSMGTMLISVDALPKKTGQDQTFTNFKAPTCEDHPTNIYCQQTPKEHWTPLHSSSKQWCNDTRVNLTFDLAPWDYKVQKYYVFLYKSDKNCTNQRGSYLREKEIASSEVETFEKEYLNQTFNMTTVIFEGLEFGESYIAGFRIADGDGGTYLMRKKCSSIATINYHPCSQNPCSTNETCISDCLTYSCECVEGTERNNNSGTCEEKDTQVAVSTEFPSLYIEIGSAAGAFVIIVIIVASVCLVRCKGPTSCKKGVNRKNQDPLISPPVLELPESPKVSHSIPSGIRLVCNLNSHLQNFTDRLRQVLQVYVGCPVSVHTVWHTTQVGSSSWIADAKNKEEKVFFIWDKNLSILDYGESRSVGMDGHMVHDVISTLQRNEFESVVLLQLDIAGSAPLPIELRHCCTYSLPCGLMDLVKDFSSEKDIPPDSFSEVMSAYTEIEKNLRQNVCKSSKQMWIEKTAENLEKQQDNGGEIASDEDELSDEEVSIEEEEAGQELLSSFSQSC